MYNGLLPKARAMSSTSSSLTFGALAPPLSILAMCFWLTPLAADSSRCDHLRAVLTALTLVENVSFSPLTGPGGLASSRLVIRRAKLHRHHSDQCPHGGS